MKKGGYQIIDLKDYNITTEGVTVKGIYDDISTNKRKVILLSGVTIKGVEFSDMFVKVVRAEDDFRLTGFSVAVDGTLSTYDFFVEDDDTVTLIEDEVSGGSDASVALIEYDVTTHAEALELIQAGKLVVVQDGSRLGIFSYMNTTDYTIFFSCMYHLEGDFILETFELAEDDSWTNASTNISAAIEAVGEALSEKMTNPMTTAGDMIGGSIEGAPYRIPKGTQGQFLGMGASFPEWQNLPSPGGADHLYWHSINIYNYNATSPAVNYTIFLIILNTTAAPIDKSALQAIVNANTTGKYVAVNGATSTNTKVPMYIQYTSDSVFKVWIYQGSTSFDSFNQTWSDVNIEVVDAVTQIF